MCSNWKKIILFLIILFLIFPQKVNAQLLINEFSPSTDPEWIELYNEGDVEADLNGYLLEDGNSSQTDDLKLTGIISGKGFFVFTHTKGWLNDGGDTIKLYNNASPSAIIDQYTYGNVDSVKSVARIPNGSENWLVTLNITNGGVNPNPTPIPTQTPTNPPTEMPTSASTEAPTASPTRSPSPVPTKSPTLKPTASSTPVESEQSEEKQTIVPKVLSLSTTSSSPKPKFEANKNSPILSIIFIILGIGFLGYGGYLLYNMRNENNKNN